MSDLARNIEHGADPPESDGIINLWVRVGGMTVWRRATRLDHLHTVLADQSREVNRLHSENKEVANAEH